MERGGGVAQQFLRVQAKTKHIVFRIAAGSFWVIHVYVGEKNAVEPFVTMLHPGANRTAVLSLLPGNVQGRDRQGHRAAVQTSASDGVFAKPVC